MIEDRQSVLVKERMLIEHAWQKWYAFQKLQRKGDPEPHSYYSEDEHDQEIPKWLLRRWIHEKLRGKNVILKPHPDQEHKPAYPWDHPMLYRELNPHAEGDDHEEEKLRAKINRCITQEQKERQVRYATPSNLYGNFSADDHDFAYTNQYNIYVSAWYPGTRNASGRRYADYIPPHDFAFTNIVDVRNKRDRPLENPLFESLTDQQRKYLWYNNMITNERSSDVLFGCTRSGAIVFGQTEFCQLRPCNATITQLDDDYVVSPDPSESYTHDYNENDHHHIARIDAEIRHSEDSYHLDKNVKQSASHEIATRGQEKSDEDIQDVKIGVVTGTNRFWTTSSEEESL
jgi:hypothetical protein